MARKILLADDSVTAQNMGRKILADAGYEVITVNNGSAALKRIAEIKPNLIVLDVYMPGYSGLEVCQRLKDSEETAHIPVLLTVGKLEPFKAEEARRVRADGHIVKPFEASELLTAISRLEDRIVPESEAGRFAGESARRAENNTSADTGWKSRLGFPSKKKKEEKEKEDLTAAAGTFRDFRKGKVKTAAAGASWGDESRPESGSDIPRDITPEELDALSALAAKLGGPKPGTDDVAALTSRTPEDTTKAALVEAPAVELAANADVALSFADAREEDAKARETVGFETFTPADSSAPAVQTPAVAAESKTEVGISVEHIEVAAADSAVPEPPSKNQPEETRHSEITAAVTVDISSLAQEPAPVDRDEEPMFASAAIRQASEGNPSENQPAEIADSTQPEAAATVGLGEVVAAKNQESQPNDLDIQTANAELLRAGHTAQPVATAAPVPAHEMAVPEEPAPSDEELAQALRLLTPSGGHIDLSTIPSHGTLVAAGQLLAEEVIRDAAARPRWIAEPVALTREEAALSLEAEMFRVFSARPAATSAATAGGEIEPVRITGVSAIAAAVENRLAAVGLGGGASANTLPEQGRGDKRGAETIFAEASAAEALTLETAAQSLAPVSNLNPVADGNDLANSAEKLEVEQNGFSAGVSEEAAEESPVRQVAAATFADVVAQDAQYQGRETTAAAPTEATELAGHDTTSQIEAEEAMGKSVKSKSGKSNWHQIHTPPAPTTTNAAGRNDVEEKMETPKAMAAAAAEGSSSSSSSSSSTSAPDAGTIASIVESVMADLRPKIVEEIVKKLAGK